VLKPAKPGTGVIAGGAMRVICDLVGIRNVVGKILGKSANKINIAEATIKALKELKTAPVPAKAPAASVLPVSPELPLRQLKDEASKTGEQVTLKENNAAE